jgi:hypothetical protein
LFAQLGGRKALDAALLPLLFDECVDDFTALPDEEAAKVAG